MSNNYKKIIIPSIITILASTPCLSAEDEDESPVLSTTVSILSSDSAVKIAQNTIKICRKKGAQISVTVVDRFGTIQAQIRDTLAAPISIPISYRKAKTAANFNTITANLGDVRYSPIANIENLLMSPGGAPIAAAGVFYGAVGVSGSTGEIDQGCATTGAASLNEDLEMQ
jgi:uncharacterized protein GlcG (DUF336 family)